MCQISKWPTAFREVTFFNSGEAIFCSSAPPLEFVSLKDWSFGASAERERERVFYTFYPLLILKSFPDISPAPLGTFSLLRLKENGGEFDVVGLDREICKNRSGRTDKSVDDEREIEVEIN